jgi:LPXTG-motif cell wall-anchored protein
MSASLRAAMATTAVVVGVGAMIAGGGSALASNDGGSGHTVTICHAKGNGTYKAQSLDVASVFSKGHTTHSPGGHSDVIPPFTYTDRAGNELPYPGRGNQAILGNGCKVPGTTEPTIPTTEPTIPTTEPEVVDETEEPTTTTVPEEIEEPETTVPEVEEPETTVPEVTVPEVTVPEVTVPEIVPEVTDPTVPVAPADPAVVPTAAPAVVGTLPATGTGTTALAIAGFGALIAGLGLVQLASNRRQSVKA